MNRESQILPKVIACCGVLAAAAVVLFAIDWGKRPVAAPSPGSERDVDLLTRLNRAGDKFEEAKKVAVEKAGEAREAIDVLRDVARVKAGDVWKTTKEKAEIAADAVTEMVKEEAGEAWETTKDKAGEAKEKAGDALDASKEKAEEILEASKEKAARAAEALRKRATETLERPLDLLPGGDEEIQGSDEEIQ